MGEIAEREVIKMRATRQTHIELDTQEITVLEEAISILKKVNKIIDDVDTDDVTISTNVDLYDTLHDELHKIEYYIED